MHDAKTITLPDVQPGMLVLSRCKGEKIIIGESIVVTVIELRGDRVRLGIQAHDTINIRRAEVPPLVSTEGGGS